MSNWTTVTEKTVTLVHHSTSSVVEIIVTREDGAPESIWLDRQELADLCKAIHRIEDMGK